MEQLKPHIALFVCNAIWAINYPLYHIVLNSGGRHHIPLLELSLIVAALFSFVPLLWSRAERVERRDIKYLFAAAILSGLLRKGLVLLGLSLTSPIDASIIASLVPVMALIISVLFGIDRFSPRRIVGILLGMGGALAITLSTPHSAGSSSSVLWGNISMLFYTVAAGLYMVWLQPLFKRYRPLTLMRWVYSLSALMFLPFSAKEIINSDILHLEPHLLGMAMFVILVPTFLPNLLLNYSMARVKPTVASTYSYLQPILAIGTSVYLGLSRPRLETLLFGVAIIAGVALVISSYEAHSTTKKARLR